MRTSRAATIATETELVVNTSRRSTLVLEEQLAISRGVGGSRDETRETLTGSVAPVQEVVSGCPFYVVVSIIGNGVELVVRGDDECLTTGWISAVVCHVGRVVGSYILRTSVDYRPDFKIANNTSRSTRSD